MTPTLVDPKTKSLVLACEDPLYLRGIFSQSQLISHPTYNIAIKHSLASTRVLRNLGYDVPAPIQHQYRWPGKYQPFKHQRVMAEFFTMHRRAFNLSDPGVGKTASTLWAADWLMEQGLVNKALILSPLSTLERVWMSDIFDVLMHRQASLVYGSRDKRLSRLETDADFYVANHDMVNIGPVMEAVRKRPDIDLVIVDEASMFRNHGTNRYKALRKLIREDMRLWMLTGTPCPNAPTDAWAQARLVDPQRVPKFYGAFRNMTMAQVSEHKWVPRHDAYKAAYDALQPAVRFRKKDCLDLPPVTMRDRQAELSKEQLKAVQSMTLQMQAEAKEQDITAVNAADKINKLRQIMCGSVRHTDTGEYVAFDYKPRLKVLMETLETSASKSIVIVPFKGIIQQLAEDIAKAYTVEVLNGDVSPKRRDQIILDFKTQNDPNTLLCHPKVMSHGLNLTEADTLIFYAPIYSNDEFQQVTERFNRAGQTRKMTITRIAAHPLEWEIYKAVDTKKVSQDLILKMYQDMLS